MLRLSTCALNDTCHSPSVRLLRLAPCPYAAPVDPFHSRAVTLLLIMCPPLYRLQPKLHSFRVPSAFIAPSTALHT